jgi:hypothetical protein
MHLTRDGHMSGRSMSELYEMYNILPYTFVLMLVLVSYLIAQRKDMDHWK